jgi:ATP-dependent helicase/nuclease subunit A
MAEDVLGQMYIGTIHGFCFQLISSGAIVGFKHELKMLNDVELKDKIRHLFEKWYEEHQLSLDENLKDFILYNKNSFLKTLTNIFTDPDLRVRWGNYKNDTEINLGASVESLTSLCLGEWKRILCVNESMLIEDNKKKPKWLEYLESYRKEVSDDSAWIFLKSVKGFFDKVGRTPPVRKDKVSEDVYDFFQSIKELKNFVKKYYDDLLFCYENKDDLLSWSEMIKEIYTYIEDHYQNVEGITFSDLEYYVYQNLVNKSASEKIYEDYSYFIIDEFQDTSQIQFSIIKEIIKNDMKKVFSVGDVKQAIYGFRGGELGVFQEASKKTYENYSLLYNYRSQGQVIAFNNSLFSYLLPLGPEYDGDSHYSVPMSEQSIPEGKNDQGKVLIHKVSYKGELPQGKKTLSSSEMNYAESLEIFAYLKNNPENQNCILYSKLRPSYYLLEQLIEEKMSFTFQVKVPFNEDPLIAMLTLFSHYHAFPSDDEEVLRKTVYQLQKTRELLNLFSMADEVLRKELLASSLWHDSLGALEAFKKFLWKMNISTSSASHVWPLIKTIIEMGDNRFELVAEYVKPMSDDTYSIDLQQGNTPDKVIVMTVHASKGLEFETVILGGIHTNGDSKSTLDSFGKEPYSFKWYPKSLDRVSIKTPQYIFEYEEAKLKSFDEYKRLFYVALTRAVNSIVCFDLSCNDKDLYYAKNSWICAIRKWLDLSVGSDIKENILKNTIRSERDIEDLALDVKRLDLKPAMVHLDSLGVIDKEVSPLKTSIILSSELSVTRLTLLDQCPRKFYLKNLLKLDSQLLEDFELNRNHNVNKVVKEGSANNNDIKSSSERGTLIHESLSQAIQRNLVLQLDRNESGLIDKRGEEGMIWILDELKKYKEKGFELVSEKAVKFSLFGQMISGTPDLVLHHVVNGQLEVWDFKTGSLSEEKNKTYWLQLYCYAYALLAQNLSIRVASLKIVYIDEKKIVSQEVEYSTIKNSLYSIWEKVDELDQVNQDHCPKCEYSQYCELI